MGSVSVCALDSYRQRSTQALATLGSKDLLGTFVSVGRAVGMVLGMVLGGIAAHKTTTPMRYFGQIQM